MSTLYRAFGDKEGLAHAIIERHMSTVTARLQDLSLSGLPPESALALVGESILDASISRESLLVHRIVIGEGRDFPELRDWFFAHAVMPSQAILTEYLEGEIAAGRLALRAPAIASRSEEHTSELQSLMRISYAVFCLKKKHKTNQISSTHTIQPEINR